MIGIYRIPVAMRNLIWNYQGAGKSHTMIALREANSTFAPIAICLLEMKLKCGRMIIMCRRLGFGNLYVVNPVRVSDRTMVLMFR